MEIFEFAHCTRGCLNLKQVEAYLVSVLTISFPAREAEGLNVI